MYEYIYRNTALSHLLYYKMGSYVFAYVCALKETSQIIAGILINLILIRGISFRTLLWNVKASGPQMKCVLVHIR